MLPPNETFEGIRTPDVFAGMIAELPWPNLKNYILANSQLSKVCQLGGYRLEPKHRKRFEGFLVKEAEKAAYSTTFCNPIFAQWYPVHEELYRVLEDHFHSDAYKASRKELGLGDDAYVLTEEKFSSFFKVEDLEKWRVLICFSPLQFTADQVKRILHDTGGNEQLLKKAKDLEALLSEARADKARLENELERQKAQASGNGDEAQALRKERRELLAEREALANKFEASQADNRKLRQAIAEKEAAANAIVNRSASGFEAEKNRLLSALDKVEKEVGGWRTRYEQQCVETRAIKDRLSQVENELGQERVRTMRQEKSVQDLQNFADLVLKRMDWAKTGKNLALNPALQKQFNSVLKKLNYESGAPSLDTTLLAFWNGLSGGERELVETVAHSNTLEVANGNANDFWQNLKEPFDDVVIGMEARLVLLKLLREIFFETLSAEDLEAPVLPKFPAARK